MWNLIVSVPDHCLSFYFSNLRKLIHGEENKFVCNVVMCAFTDSSIIFDS